MADVQGLIVRLGHVAGVGVFSRVLKKSPSWNSFLSTQPAGFGFGSIDAGERHA
jgi:hypothetical protein